MALPITATVMVPSSNSPRRTRGIRAASLWRGTPHMIGARRLQVIGDAERAPQEADETDDERQWRGLVERRDARSEFVSDHRELGQGRMDDVVLGLGVVTQHQPDHGDEEQQKREHGQEAVEGDEGGKRSAPIVPVLLQYRDRNGRERPTSLAVVQPAEEPPPEVQRATAAGVNEQSRCLIPLMNGERRRSGSPVAVMSGSRSKSRRNITSISWRARCAPRQK